MRHFTFDQIKAFAIAELGTLDRPITERTDLAHDFGIAGLDGKDFMEAYAQCFDVDLGDFDWIEHFGAEGSSGGPFSLLRLLWQRVVHRIPSRELDKLPDLTLGHLLECANEGRWKRPSSVRSAVTT